MLSGCPEPGLHGIQQKTNADVLSHILSQMEPFLRGQSEFWNLNLYNIIPIMTKGGNDTGQTTTAR